MSQSVSKKHDSIMNGLDFSIECSTGLDWLTFASTAEYDVISAAVWKICAGETTEKEESQ